MRTRSPLSVALPRTPEERTADLEAAMNRIHVSFEQEIKGLHKAMRTMDAAHRAANEEAGRGRGGQGRGEHHQGQSTFENRDPVKAIGDVRRTMHAICQIPKLSHAMLSDFDQWKQEMHNTIVSARTNDPKYNQVNIEFIYASIDLDLRDQAVGHKPSKITMIKHITPKCTLMTWKNSTCRLTISQPREASLKDGDSRPMSPPWLTCQSCSDSTTELSTTTRTTSSNGSWPGC